MPALVAASRLGGNGAVLSEMAGTFASEATPFGQRLCPAMTEARLEAKVGSFLAPRCPYEQPPP